MISKRILFWDSTVSDMKSGRKFGGIAVQLNFWMQIFNDNGWSVHALTEAESYSDTYVTYHHIRHIQSIELAWEWSNIYRIIKKVKPQLILFRGARRLLYPLSIIAHRFSAKVIMQGASDVNFEPGKASVGNRINRWLYEHSIRKIDFIIAQNNFQKDSLISNFGRESMVIPNIWEKMDVSKSAGILPEAEVVWVGNFRKLKRPEWFYQAARNLPRIEFAIAGGSAEVEYYDKMAHEAISIPNMAFLGPITIEESNALIQRAKILVCSSEYEGFPNTFLQAWSAGIPVISTVDPNNLIKNHNLGLVVDSPHSLSTSITDLLRDQELYKNMRSSIAQYFSTHHSSKKYFDELMAYIKDIHIL